MKGDIQVTVISKRLRYNLVLHRNITVIQGDSGTGKTRLVQLVRDYSMGLAGPGTQVICEKDCIVLEGRKERALQELENLKETVVFIDEKEPFLKSREFAEGVKKSDCYFVIITRDSLHMLPYSIKEIYYMRSSGIYQNTRQTYHEIEPVYDRKNMRQNMVPQLIVTEDSNAGHEMFSHICKQSGISCITAGGKSNVSKILMEYAKDGQVLAIVDGAAFGADMENVMKVIEQQENASLWAPESFEYLLLKAGIVQYENLKDILEEPGRFIESRDFFSWERYFTRMLEDITKGTIYAYSKKNMNEKYLTKGNVEKFLEQIPENIKIEKNHSIEKNAQEKCSIVKTVSFSE